MKTEKKTPKKVFDLGSKSYSLALGRLLQIRKELSEQKYAQLSALAMQKIAEKIELIGFEKIAKKLFDKLGKPTDGLYQDITPEKITLFIEAATLYWQKGYAQNEAHKAEVKAIKRQETLARIAETTKKRIQEAKENSI